MSSNTNHPPKILIFDSGVGGLSVYKEIRKILPDFEYIYLFDNKAYPYGELAKETLIERVTALTSDMHKHEQIDLVVIACNTASTIVLPHLRQLLNIPVVGVVPAIKPASLIATQAVGLIATPATIKREYTHNLIQDFSANIPVQLLGSTRLVDIAEEKMCGTPVDKRELTEILAPLIGEVDVAVLGCTHFPLIKEEIASVFNHKVTLIDSGEAIARRVKSLLPEDISGKVNNKRYKIFCSAALNNKAALDKVVKELNFLPIEMFQSLDV